VLKLIGVTVSYATGNAGGIFGPALLLGSMPGGAIGTVAHHFLPGYTASPGAYALVGMGALFAGIVRAPMTSVLMIFEMTHDYAVIVPLMIANLTSLFIASRLQKEPIYEALAHQDGIHLPSSAERTEANQRTVLEVMQSAPRVLPVQMGVRESLELIGKDSLRIWPVTDKERFIGIVSREGLENAVAEETGDRLLVNLVKTVNVPFVFTDQPVFIALERMSRFHMDLLPVVDRADATRLLGVVTLHDVLDSYEVDQIRAGSRDSAIARREVD
jgi:chloride channel protein, CIC family